MKTAIVVLAVLLAGCNATMSNRLACTVSKDKAFFVSEYGPVGMSAVIDDRDAAAVCK